MTKISNSKRKDVDGIARVKKEISSNKSRPALTSKAREDQLISLAMDRAEEKLRDGTASSQLILEFVKRGATKSQLEKEILAEKKELMEAKKEMIKSAAHIEEIYKDALNAFRGYSGQETDDET